MEFPQEVTQEVEGDKTHGENTTWRQRLEFAALSQRMLMIASDHQKLRKRQGTDPSPEPTGRNQPSDTCIVNF